MWFKFSQEWIILLPHFILPYFSNDSRRTKYKSCTVLIKAFLSVTSAIEAMKNAHRTELEKELDRARKANSNTENADIEEIRRQHE